jgi:hypothetical protein
MPDQPAPDPTGTLPFGHFDASAAEITALFGPPSGPTPDGKIRVRWVIQTGHGVATIYDLACFSAPASEDQVVTWSLGGINVDCTRSVVDQLLAARKTPEVEYVELRRRDPAEAVLLMASVVAEQKRQLVAIRDALGMPPDLPHDDVIRELRQLRGIVTELAALLERHNIKAGL